MRIPSAPTTAMNPVPVNVNYWLKWDPSLSGASFRLEEKAGSAWQEIYDGGQATKMMSKATAGSYQYRLKACRGSTCTAWSPLLTVVVSQQIPPQPQNLAATPTNSTDGNFTIRWDASVGATYYQVRENYNQGTITDRGTVAAPQWSPSPPKNRSGSYAYSVSACNTAGCSPYNVGAVATVSLPVTLVVGIA